MRTLILWNVNLEFERGIKATYRVNATSKEQAKLVIERNMKEGRTYKILSIDDIPQVIDSVLIV